MSLKVKKKKHKFLKRFLLLVMFVILLISVFYATYYFSMNNSYSDYERTVKSFINQINTLNSSTDTLIKNKTLNTDKALKDLPSKIDTLKKIKDSIDALNPTAKYVKDQENLIEGINNNYLLYKQTLLILQNPTSDDLQNSLDNINKYRDSCMNSYSLVNIKNSSIILPESFLNFVDYTFTYTNTLLRNNKDTAIKKSLESDFIDSIDEIISNFDSIKIEYSSQLDKARSDGDKGYDLLLAQIDKNASTLQVLEQNLASVSIPSSASTSYGILKKCLDEYDVYCQNYKYAVSNEKMQAPKYGWKNEALNALYTNSKTMFTNLQKDYDSFNKSYAALKARN